MKITYIAALSISALFASCVPFPGKPQPVGTSGNSGEVAAPKIDNLNVPIARPLPNGGQKNKVISPYKPYNVIDVKGYKSGDIVGDPSTGTLDDKGKLIPNTAKHFRIP